MSFYTEMTHLYDQTKNLKIKARDLRLTLVSFWKFLAVRCFYKISETTPERHPEITQCYSGPPVRGIRESLRTA